MVSLINEKCIPAALPEICIARQGLMKKLKLAAEGRFTYIGAPAGSGKTVTALLWNAFFDENEKQKSLWITLDAYDNVPSVFYKLLAMVLSSTQPENENMKAILDDPAFSSSPVEHTVKLIAEMQNNKNLYTLTFDDIHLLNNQDILKSLPAVLKRLPQSISMLFLSRNEIPEPLQGLFRSEKTAILSAEDLRFSEEELKSYFQNLGRDISSKEAEIVLMATGGLAISINAIAKSGHIELGKTEYVFANFVREHLWNSWNKNLQDFLLKTSIVDEVNEKLAIILTGRKDAGKVLQKLCVENTFVSKAGNGLYRYHHLFLAFLRDMVSASLPASGINFAVLYKAAAKYYLDAKQYLIARHYAVRSGDDQMILKVIYQFNQYTNPTLDEYLEYYKIFSRDVLPHGTCDKFPYLYTSIMEGSWIASDCKTVELAWDKLRQYLPVIALKYPKILETVIVELCADYRKPFAKLIAEYKKLPPIIKPNKKYQVSTFTLQLPFMHRSIRDWCELANKSLIEKMEKTFGLLLYDLLPAIKPCILSGFALEQNCLNEALEFALQANDISANIQSPEVVFCTYNQLAAVYLTMGNKTKLNDTLNETESYIAKSGARFLDRNFLAWKTKIALYNADIKTAVEWLDNYFISDEENVPLYKIYQYFTTVRACIVLNDGRRAMALINGIINFAKDYRRPLDLAEALTLKACLQWASGNRADGTTALREALKILQEKKFINIIADEGVSVMPILKRIAPTNSEINKEYLMEVILAAYERSKNYSGITANFKKTGKPIKLSKQQKKMLEYLAKGYSNPQISKLTGLAVPTVKGHLMLAYEKLEVHTAYEALNKAKSLGLLV